jgi:hypothetical protein
MLKNKYNIPSGPESVLTVWDVGEGICGTLREKIIFVFLI